MVAHRARMPPLVAFVAVAFAAHCGGKVDEGVAGDKDAAVHPADGATTGDDSATGDDGRAGDDATTTSEICALGAACSFMSCTNLGAGPCASDQQFQCIAGSYAAAGFTCESSPDSSCSVASAGPSGCSEQCDCVNGLETCTGNCDGGR